jgi:hypothetical protein
MEQKKTNPLTHLLKVAAGFLVALAVYLIVKGVG